MQATQRKAVVRRYGLPSTLTKLMGTDSAAIPAGATPVEAVFIGAPCSLKAVSVMVKPSLTQDELFVRACGRGGQE